MMAGAKEKTVTALLWERTHINTKRKQQDFARCRLKAHASFHGKRPELKLDSCNRHRAGRRLT